MSAWEESRTHCWMAWQGDTSYEPLIHEAHTSSPSALGSNPWCMDAITRSCSILGKSTGSHFSLPQDFL